jgi:hypothetical protein
MGTLIVRGGDGFESLLASGVPNLELDGAAAWLKCSDFEVDTDSWEEAISIEGYLSLKMLSENLRSKLDFPTEEFPMRRSLKR